MHLVIGITVVIIITLHSKNCNGVDVVQLCLIHGNIQYVQIHHSVGEGQCY